ncbi:hypothetical protein D3C75_1175830 [compost metagenome]
MQVDICAFGARRTVVLAIVEGDIEGGGRRVRADALEVIYLVIAQQDGVGTDRIGFEGALCAIDRRC